MGKGKRIFSSGLMKQETIVTDCRNIRKLDWLDFKLTMAGVATSMCTRQRCNILSLPYLCFMFFFVFFLWTGFYGRGVYFSEYPSYSVSYIRGASRLLLCQVLPGNVYRCTNLIHGEPLEVGHDSHTSPDGKELVIFNSHHILPSYVVHYGEAIGDFTYETTDT